VEDGVAGNGNLLSGPAWHDVSPRLGSPHETPAIGGVGPGAGAGGTGPRRRVIENKHSTDIRV